MVTKKLTIALALIMGSFSATFAGTPKSVKDASIESQPTVTTPSPETSKPDGDETLATYYWFDANTNQYIGQSTQSDQQSECGTPGDSPCANGYNSKTANNQPVGSVASYTTKDE